MVGLSGHVLHLVMTIAWRSVRGTVIIREILSLVAEMLMPMVLRQWKWNVANTSARVRTNFFFGKD